MNHYEIFVERNYGSSLDGLHCQLPDEDYLQDGGKHNPYYNGTVLEYLNQHPDKHYFSELTDLIHYAGLDSVLQNEEITFFCPDRFFD